MHALLVQHAKCPLITPLVVNAGGFKTIFSAVKTSLPMYMAPTPLHMLEGTHTGVGWGRLEVGKGGACEKIGGAKALAEGARLTW